MAGFAHGLNVAETRFRASRRNAKDDHAALAASDFQGGAHDDAIALGISDVMIGGENGEECVSARGTADMQGGQRNGSGGVSTRWRGGDTVCRGGGAVSFYLCSVVAFCGASCGLPRAHRPAPPRTLSPRGLPARHLRL